MTLTRFRELIHRDPFESARLFRKVKKL